MNKNVESTNSLQKKKKLRIETLERWMLIVRFVILGLAVALFFVYYYQPDSELRSIISIIGICFAVLSIGFIMGTRIYIRNRLKKEQANQFEKEEEELDEDEMEDREEDEDEDEEADKNKDKVKRES